MKLKIFESLKRTYSAKYGVSDDILQGYAESLASTGLITDDNLATVIQGQEYALKEFQRGFDKVRTESSSYKNQLDDLLKKQKEQDPQPQPTQPIQGAEMPEWFKSYKSENDNQIEELKAALTQGQVATQREKRDALFNQAINGLSDTHATPLKAAYALLGDNVDEAKFQEFITNTQNSTKEIIAHANTYTPLRGGKANDGLDANRIAKKEEEYRQKISKK